MVGCLVGEWVRGGGGRECILGSEWALRFVARTAQVAASDETSGAEGDAKPQHGAPHALAAAYSSRSALPTSNFGRSVRVLRTGLRVRAGFHFQTGFRFPDGIPKFFKRLPQLATQAPGAGLFA